MITEKIDSYSLFVQGFRDASVTDSERVLKDLRESFQGVDLQLLRADRVAGKEQVIFAARNAISSFGGKDRRAKHLSMEFLLFASGEHQIIEAIKRLGVTASNRELALVALSQTSLDSNRLINEAMESVKGIRDDTVLQINTQKKVEELKRVYSISDKELNASKVPSEEDNTVLKRLILERSALLALEN